MKIDQYELKARIFPAVFSMIIPVIIFNHFFVSEKLADFFNYMDGFKILSNITISGILLYFISQFGRVLGKGVFEKLIFSDELRMPTTEMLLFSNKTFSDHHKVKIREKVFRDFSIALPTQTDEDQDGEASRTRIVEAMALVRKKLAGNKFLLQHNIEYGAMRNAIGGSVIGLIFSAINIVCFTYVVPASLAVAISLATAAIYLVIILFSKALMNLYSRSYAKILFREYLID